LATEKINGKSNMRENKSGSRKRINTHVKICKISKRTKERQLPISVFRRRPEEPAANEYMSRWNLHIIIIIIQF